MEDKDPEKIVNEIFELLVSRNVSFAEAQEILNTLRNKMYASAKIK